MIKGSLDSVSEGEEKKKKSFTKPICQNVEQQPDSVILFTLGNVLMFVEIQIPFFLTMIKK